ncbi:ParB/RepB/Spo0J family partition protein [Achromobacter spanius]|uniref:ParB/RepB/Spo0J family partition protein n=1 Tax=Achromobacter spanius TaxID=217203 RepID=UPI0038020DC1
MNNTQAEVSAVQNAAAVAPDAPRFPTVVVPLSRLRMCDKYQMRRTATAEAVEGLKALGASLAIVQLQNVVGYEAEDGMIALPAGGRRLQAFQMQRDEGNISPDHPVSVLLIPESLAAQASIIENEHRAAPHLADVYAAYASLRSSGMSVEEIALSQGTTVGNVQKLLALADVSPALFALFRENSASLAMMQALASVPDHARQEAAWDASKNTHASYRVERIRSFLSADEIPARSTLVRYVTLQTYQDAGGEIRRDLFADDEDGVYLKSPDLVNELAKQKLARSRKVKALANEGWGWIEFIPTFDYDTRKAFGGGRNYLHSADDWDASVKALAGCVVHLEGDGSIGIDRGLVRAEDRKAVAALQKQAKAKGQEIKGLSLPAADTRPEHSQALLQRLAAQKVAAIQAELLKSTELATRLFVAQMSGSMFSRDDRTHRWFDASVNSAAYDLTKTDESLVDSAAWKAIEAQEQMWKGLVPTDAKARTVWILEQPMELVTRLQSYLVARSFYRTGTTWGDTNGAHIDSMASLIDLDMAAWWTATADSYFSHVSKAQIVDAVVAATDKETAAPLEGMKKGEAAKAAEVALAGKRWLPSPLQTETATAETPRC